MVGSSFISKKKINKKKIKFVRHMMDIKFFTTFIFSVYFIKVLEDSELVLNFNISLNKICLIFSANQTNQYCPIFIVPLVNNCDLTECLKLG